MTEAEKINYIVCMMLISFVKKNKSEKIAKELE